MSQAMAMTVNGRAVTVTVDDPEMPLLYALRNDLGLTGPHYGCGLGQCGACTVHVDGVAVRSCQIPVSAVTSAKNTTVGGLGEPGKTHPPPAAPIPEQATQNAHWINGGSPKGAALLGKKTHPT